MIDKILENEHCDLIMTITGIVLAFIINKMGDVSRSVVENGYEVSATVTDHGEICIKPSHEEEKDGMNEVSVVSDERL